MRTGSRKAASIVGACLIAAAIEVPASSAREPEVLIFAAASLQTALDAVAEGWREEEGGDATISYAATSALARQIEQGAPVDLFISADLDWMEYLAERGLVRSETTTNLLGNRIVLVAPAGSTETIEIDEGLDLAGMLNGGRLAIADTMAVPAGRYARAALISLGLWESVAGQLAPAENVRAALAFVSRGETPLGIVYVTDDIADPTVVAVGMFPADAHPPILYPAAILTTSDNPAAMAFLTFVRSATAQCIFEAQGFVVLDDDGEPAAPVPCNDER